MTDIPQNTKFTRMRTEHPGHPAPGGEGQHSWTDPNGGTIWTIRWAPEVFEVYRRWADLPVIEGEFLVLSGDEQNPANEEDGNGPLEAA